VRERRPLVEFVLVKVLFIFSQVLSESPFRFGEDSVFTMRSSQSPEREATESRAGYVWKDVDSSLAGVMEAICEREEGERGM